MRRRTERTILTAMLLLVVSCNEPETIVTNYINADGTVTRKIEMRNRKNEFSPSDFKVPVDSSWTIKDSIEINGKDTLFHKIAIKKFSNIDEINREYAVDKGINRNFSRKVIFKKKFRFFYTVCRFAEHIEKNIQHGYPVCNYLNNEELKFFYLPEIIVNEKLGSSDSLKIKILKDSVEAKTDKWLWSSIASEWIEEFVTLISQKSSAEPDRDSLKRNENRIVKILAGSSSKSDTSLIREIIGESNYRLYRAQADSSVSVIDKKIDRAISLKEYTIKAVMPGRVIGTNGFFDEKGELLWPVRWDLCFTENYEMWAESKITNTWAWIIAGIFLVFVASGIIFRKIKRD
jgi:hypothetical protein